MTRRLVERVFDPRVEVIARRPFTANGKHFHPGDLFDWRRDAVDLRRVRQLYDAGKLMHPHEATVQRPAPAPEPPAPEPPAPAVAAVEAPNPDGLDDLAMPELRDIAKREGAAFKVSRSDQREAIRAHRAEQSRATLDSA